MPIFRYFPFFLLFLARSIMLIFSIFSYFIFLFLNFLSLFVLIFCETACTRRFSVIFAKVQWHPCLVHWSWSQHDFSVIIVILGWTCFCSVCRGQIRRIAYEGKMFIVHISVTEVGLNYSRARQVQETQASSLLLLRDLECCTWNTAERYLNTKW